MNPGNDVCPVSECIIVLKVSVHLQIICSYKGGKPVQQWSPHSPCHSHEHQEHWVHKNNITTTAWMYSCLWQTLLCPRGTWHCPLRPFCQALLIFPQDNTLISDCTFLHVNHEQETIFIHSIASDFYVPFCVCPELAVPESVFPGFQNCTHGIAIFLQNFHRLGPRRVMWHHRTRLAKSHFDSCLSIRNTAIVKSY